MLSYLEWCFNLTHISLYYRIFDGRALQKWNLLNDENLVA